jgi:internalin A
VADLGPLARLAGLQSLNLVACAGVADLGPLARLAGLQHLDLSFCAGVADLGPLARLAGLQSLVLSVCSGLRHFEPLRGLLTTLENLCLHNCHFDDLPHEVCGELYDENVLDKVRAHYEDLGRGAVEDSELKLFVLGNGGVGKTQMCRRLRNLLPDFTLPTTHGVELGSFSLVLEDHSTTITVRYWDFGGQDVYHGTHALFLQGHAVFVVLWTPDREQGDAGEQGVPIRHRPLAYWLDYVRGLAGTASPVLVVQSQCDDARQRQRPPAPTDDFRYPSELQFSAKTGLGLDMLKAHIKEGVRNLLAARPLHLIGAGRVEVRDRLRAMLAEDRARPPAQRQHRTLTQAEFQALCEATGKVSDPGALLDFLHRCGVVFYRKGLFEDRIILDQAWALDAIYTIFDRQRALPYLIRDGRFTRQTLAVLAWEKYSAEEQETFLGMMRSCGICFPLTSRSWKGTETEYVAPDLLPEEDHPYTREQLSGRIPDEAPDATATVRYRFLHEGILRGLLSRIGVEARDGAVYWRYGCWFAEETTRSRVRIRSRLGTRADQPGAGEITLNAWGTGAAKLIDAVLATLERIPVGHQPEVERTDSRRGLPTPDVVATARGIEGLVIAPPPAPPATDKQQIFLSYAWGDDRSLQGRQREEVVERLCARLAVWDYEVVLDKKAMRRGDKISKFMETLARGNRVVVVLSEKYLRSVYCMSELHGIYKNARSDEDDFLGRVIPLSLDDAHISRTRDRAEHARYWENEVEQLRQYTVQQLGEEGCRELLMMCDWARAVPQMLAHIANILRPQGFDAIVADDFAAVKELLDRGR